MNRYSFILISLIVSLISCNNKQDEKLYTNEIHVLDNKLKCIRTSEFIDDIRFIPLETDSEGIIGEISKIIKTEDKYFILDSESAKKIFVFDLKGSFLYTIGTLGKGPGEYQNPKDFCIDEDNGYLLILDPYYKLIKTDLKGNFIMEKSLPENFRYIDEVIAFEGFIYGSTGLSALNIKNYKVVRFDKNLSPVGKQLPYKDPLPFHTEFISNFHINNNELFFIAPYNYVIYKIHKDEFAPYYVFNFSNKEVKINELDLSGTFRKNKSFIMGRLILGTNLIYSWIWDEGMFYNGFFLKEKNKFIVTNDIKHDNHRFFPPVSYKDGKFIAIINSYVFDELYPDNDFDIDPSDNPVIVEYELSFKN